MNRWMGDTLRSTNTSIMKFFSHVGTCWHAC